MWNAAVYRFAKTFLARVKSFVKCLWSVVRYKNKNIKCCEKKWSDLFGITIGLPYWINIGFRPRWYVIKLLFHSRTIVWSIIKKDHQFFAYIDFESCDPSKPVAEIPEVLFFIDFQYETFLRCCKIWKWSRIEK